ncbi:transposase [Plebeiibacterium sediminum]|uniref:Transposase n=1 Tax=Plebeiibacterium sediminum TaxID=2992112 RepID=A0AAE3M9H3_9BACT|nr:transposase [Plebeiobacterium sediminum]MCW3789746.1 transposase [Plebeiobacterium sediminum]
MKRRNHTSAFKAQVAIEALKERESLSELAMRFKVSQSQISKWKQAFLENSSSVFERSTQKPQEEQVDVQDLYKKIGRLEMEKDYLKKNLKKLGL